MKILPIIAFSLTICGIMTAAFLAQVAFAQDRQPQGAADAQVTMSRATDKDTNKVSSSMVNGTLPFFLEIHECLPRANAKPGLIVRSFKKSNSIEAWLGRVTGSFMKGLSYPKEELKAEDGMAYVRIVFDITSESVPTVLLKEKIEIDIEGQKPATPVELVMVDPRYQICIYGFDGLNLTDRSSRIAVAMKVKDVGPENMSLVVNGKSCGSLKSLFHTPDGGPRRTLPGATLRNDIETVKVLLDKGADINENDGGTALMIASGKGYREIAQVLLDKGADVNIKDDLYGYTAVILAGAGGNADIVKLLLDKGADINAKSTEGVSALILASMRGHTDIVKLLLDRGANPNIKSNKGETALSKASTDKIKALLSAAGAN